MRMDAFRSWSRPASLASLDSDEAHGPLPATSDTGQPSYPRLPAMSDTALGPGHGHIIVCGTDHLGLRTVVELRRRDETVIAIDTVAGAADPLTGLDVELVTGDPVAPSTLRAARVQDAAAIVMTGGADLDNLNIALAAQELNPAIRS